MAQSKQDLGSSEERWHYAALKKGFTCERCGEVPPYEEREIFFETRLCSWCEHMSSKED
jgi:hypothetical protein